MVYFVLNCLDVNECKMPDFCPPNFKCTKIPGMHPDCECTADGFQIEEGENGTKCVGKLHRCFRLLQFIATFTLSSHLRHNDQSPIYSPKHKQKLLVI